MGAERLQPPGSSTKITGWMVANTSACGVRSWVSSFASTGKREEYVVQGGFAHRDGHRVGQGAQHAGELAGTGGGDDHHLIGQCITHPLPAPRRPGSRPPLFLKVRYLRVRCQFLRCRCFGAMLADVPAPFPLPIGLRLSQTTRVVERAFDEALGEAGGTLPVWLILLNLKIRKPANQRELAEAVGVREPTLTHHLNAMDAGGLVTRTRDAANRRIHVVALTEAGEAAFARLRDAATAFDAKLRAGLADADLATLSTLLGHLAANAGAAEAAPPWAGLAEHRPNQHPDG